MRSGWTRRELLEALAGAGVGLGAAALWVGRPAVGTQGFPWSSRGAESARVIGAAYLSAHPEESAVLPAFLRGLRARPGDARGLAGELAALVRADFERGNTVRLDGWVLSRTEARLCALTCDPP